MPIALIRLPIAVQMPLQAPAVPAAQAAQATQAAIPVLKILLHTNQLLQEQETPIAAVPPAQAIQAEPVRAHQVTLLLLRLHHLQKAKEMMIKSGFHRCTKRYITKQFMRHKGSMFVTIAALNSAAQENSKFIKMPTAAEVAYIKLAVS